MGKLTWEMLSWHCETDRTPGSSTFSFRLLPEPLLSVHTVRWCLGCFGSGWTDSVLEITSIRPGLAGFSCSMLSWMEESSLLSPNRIEEICWRSDGAVNKEVESLCCNEKSTKYGVNLELSWKNYSSRCISPGSDCGSSAEDLICFGDMSRCFISWMLPLVLSLMSL